MPLWKFLRDPKGLGEKSPKAETCHIVLNTHQGLFLCLKSVILVKSNV